MGKAFLYIVAAGAVLGLIPAHRHAAPPISQTAAGPVLETVLERHSNGHFFVDATVNGQLVHFLVDTGATDVALTAEDAERVGIGFSSDEFVEVGQGAAGPVRGKRVNVASISIEGKEARNLPGVVIEGGDMSLLGQAYLSRLNSVTMAGEYMTLR